MTQIAEEEIRMPSSFRDPDGFIIFNNNKVQRVILPSYYPQYAHLMNSGLYAHLVNCQKLVSHDVVYESEAKIIIEPKQIPFVSYFYEWPFHVLKEAALLTLDIIKTALQYGMCLKDASSFNIHLMAGKPIFIDTLSFTLYREGEPWGAYGQFCRHFLAPLLLIKYKHTSFSKILNNFIDGLPLDLVSGLLPAKTHFSPFIKLNVHSHAKKLRKYNSSTTSHVYLPKNKLLHILNYMTSFINALDYSEHKTEWSDYYHITNYSQDAFNKKAAIVSKWVEQIEAKTIWDVGSNNGHFSRLIAQKKELVISTDIDPVAVDNNYLLNKKKKVSSIIPLIIDVTNPSPSIGFNNQERFSFSERLLTSKIDCVLALALIHHLCLSNNCTFSMVLDYFKKLTRFLIIEFIPPGDSWVDELLNRKRGSKHLFHFYNQDAFEKACLVDFLIVNKTKIEGSQRTLYLLKVK
ncbi:class I SAM-dependent methyltransferase [Legionella fairfieldensis]|uniref:class I SAM-dependent methyltransferase n=1 Tax=Legionella fairfieldensis TaxID=45064 RepID=UPI0006844218|nr:class I SAM-dependent methyltransferase [Legionella fairfieldensis]